jgi:2-oxoisovalerate dehydrogenase E2 component (dihydrolipoyl transacylase)
VVLVSRVKDFNLPDLGEGLTEGEIVKWLVSVGDTVTLNQPIVEVETAKAVVEIPAKWAGQVIAIHHPDGSVVDVGVPIVTIDTEPGTPLDAVELAGPEEPTEPGMIGGPTAGGRTAVLVGYGPKTTEAKRRPRKPPTPSAASATAGAPLAQAGSAVGAQTPAASTSVATPQAPAGVGGEVAVGNGSAVHVLAKPPVRKLAKDLGIDLAAVAPTGPGGVITRADVEAHAAAPAGADVAATAGGAVSAAAAYEPAPVVSAQGDTRVPVKGVQKVMAQAMVASAFTAPHVTEWITVDVSATMELVERLKGDKAFRDLRVSPLLIVAKAVTLAARRTPIINAAWDEQAQEIVYKGAVNLGIAAATPRGLIVPNIKGADSLTLPDLCRALNDLVAVAREGKTQPADQAGGSFTITNVGVFGVDAGTPIINPGEAAILAFGAVRKQPWVVNDEIVPRWVTTLALSFDHRLIDGEKGSIFLSDVASILEDPARALMF